MPCWEPKAVERPGGSSPAVLRSATASSTGSSPRRSAGCGSKCGTRSPRRDGCASACIAAPDQDSLMPSDARLLPSLILMLILGIGIGLLLALLYVQHWKARYTQAIRQDAVQRSQAVTAGKVHEQLVPYLPEFGFNPKDARFLGSPVDLLVFDGLAEGELRRVVFIEIKTGASALTGRERQLRDVVRARAAVQTAAGGINPTRRWLLEPQCDQLWVVGDAQRVYLAGQQDRQRHRPEVRSREHPRRSHDFERDAEPESDGERRHCGSDLHRHGAQDHP